MVEKYKLSKWWFVLMEHSVIAVCNVMMTDPEARARLFPSCRLVLAIIGFFMFLHLYAQRVGMSVAIVCMVNQTAIAKDAHDANETKIIKTACERESANKTVEVSQT